MNFLNSEKNLNRVFYGGCVILLLKLLIIDIDIPNWNISQYSPIDEFYYLINAFNFFDNNNFYGVDEPILFGNSIILNAVSLFFLELFGDNYLGMRFVSFLFGFFTYITIFLSLKRVKTNYLIHSLILVFLVFNFSFSNASFIVEPTIVRIATSLVSIVIISNWLDGSNKKEFNVFIITFVISTLMLLTYVTNAFVLFALFLILIIDRDTVNLKFWNTFINAKILKRVLYYILGILTSLIFYYFINYLLNCNLIDDIFNRGGKYSSRIAFDFLSLIKYVLFVFRSNVFISNPLFLLTGIYVILNIQFSTFKQWSNLKFVTAVFLFTVIIQSFFLNDFPERKLIILLPFILILIGTNFDKIDLKSKTRLNLSYYKIGGYLLAMSLVFLVFYKYSRIDKLGWLFFIIGVGFIIYQKYSNKFNNNVFILIMGVLLITPEITNTFYYNVWNRTYEFKKANKKLSAYGDKQFLGGFSLGFRLYNSVDNKINPYYYYDRDSTYSASIESYAKQNSKKDFSIDYLSRKADWLDRGFKPLDTLIITKEDSVISIYEEIIN